MATLQSSLPVQTTSYTHAVSRSSELLSCARTAVKIAKKQNASVPPSESQGAWWTVNVSSLALYDTQQAHFSHEVLEDGLSLLRAMEGELKHLETLVRRRGHTNDPTEEISLSVKRLETDNQELIELIQSMIPPTARSQRQRHWQILQQWFQSVSQQQAGRLKEIFKIRGKVLEEQAQRRKRFQASSNTTNTTTAGQFDNPLFTAAPTRRPPPAIVQPKPTAATLQPTAMAATNTNGRAHQPTSANNGASTNGGSTPAIAAPAVAAPASAPYVTTQRNGRGAAVSAPATTSAAAAQRPRPAAGGYSYYGNGAAGYGGGTAAAGGYGGVGTGGYGGSKANASYYTGSTGMRQRRNVAASSTTQDQQAQSGQIQEQLQIRQQERQSQQRLQEARQAEKSLAELGAVFGKMSTLISQQSEVIDKVEDDVEAALFDVSAGQQEIQTLYSIKKGNRGLIIKVFGILIFFIIFMRLYKK